MREIIQRRWLELEPLLDAVLDMSEAQRSEWIAAHCTDAELHAALDCLLDAAPAGAAILGRVQHELSGDLHELIGSAIGPYTIRWLLGEGGTASVFLAERQSAEFVQRVALKLLRVGVYRRDQVEQFRREQRLHARLEHPHIARVYDSGITAAGVPYLVMEYIDGAPITVYCDAKRVSLVERLRLFAQVCEAVQFAHQNLIVHRDLKPSNVLVSGDGELKLVDFGIAKLLASDTHATRTEQRQLTPGYAAPEQFSGAPVTTATDVYALGVLLHELLSGQRPVRSAAGDATTMSKTAIEAEHAACCALAPQALQRRLRGDLDCIVAKALKDEPQRRYTDATALREDILRYLAGKPIQARPDAWTYRSGKFIARYKLGIAAFASLLLILIAATLFSLHQARFAQAQAQRAEAEAGRANAIKQFLLDLFESSAPGDAQHVETADAILTKGLEQAQTKFTAQPDFQVEVLRTVGDIQQRRGQYDMARLPLEQALALAQKQFGAGDARTLDAVVALSRLDEAKDEYAQAQSILQTAISAHRAQTGAESVSLAHALQQLGMMRLRQHQTEPAVQLERQALDMFKRLLPTDSVEINEAMIGLGDALDHTGKSEQAEDLFREVVARTRRRYGDVHVLTAEALGYLASPLRELGHVDEAEAALREAVAINSKVYLSPNQHATDALYELGKTLRAEGKAAASEAVFRQELAIERQLFSGGHPNIATTLNNIAHARALLGNFAEAEQLQREALAMDLRLRGEDHPYIAKDRASLARSLIREDKLDEAAQLLTAATAADHKRYGDSHELIATDLLIAAELAVARGESNGVGTQASAAIAMFEHELPPRSPKLLTARLDAGRVLLAARDFAKAEPMFNAAVADARAGTPVVALHLAQALAGLGDAQAGQAHADFAGVSWRDAQQALVLAPETDAALADRLAAQLKASAP